MSQIVNCFLLHFQRVAHFQGVNNTCKTLKKLTIMTEKHRELFDAIMDKMIQIDKRENFKYYLTGLQIDWYCTHFQKKVEDCITFAQIHALRKEFFDTVNPLREYKNESCLADFFCRSSFDFSLRYYLHEMYMKVKSGEPFYFECDFKIKTLKSVLCCLSKF